MNIIKKFTFNHPFIFLLFFCLFLNLIYELGSISFFEQKNIVVYIFLTVVFVVGVLALFLYIKSNLSDHKICIILGVLSFLLHLVYILCISTEQYQHDLYFDNDGGHIGYILYILKQWTLPNFHFSPIDKVMFTHPPLHHILSAIWIKINIFIHASIKNQVFESLQFLTLFYSGCIMIVFYKLLRELMFAKLALIIPFAIICFHPQLIIFSGSINNDILVLALSLVIILFVIRWYKNPNIKTIVKIAIFLGLAIMTKLSGIILVPAIFMIILIKYLKNKDIGLLKQLLFLCLIFIPVGLLWFIYNYIKWDIPFFYIGGTNRLSLINNYNYIIQKLFIIDFNVFKDIFTNQRGVLNYNVLAVLLKTSVFGDFNHGNSLNILITANILLYSHAVLIITAIYSIIIGIIDKTRDYILKVFLYTIFATNVLLYLVFCGTSLKISDADFRYLPLVIFIGGIAIAFVLDDIQYKDRFSAKFYKKLVIIFTPIFCLSSIVLYLSIL